MIKIIHQIWIGTEVPPQKYVKYMKDIQVKHPDYEYILWNNDSINEYFKDDTIYHNLINTNVPIAGIVDYIRMKLLYNFGGWYIDVDSELINPLDSILLPVDKVSIFCTIENVCEIGVIYSDKNNKMLLKLSEIYGNSTYQTFYDFSYRLTISDIIKNDKSAHILGQRYFYAKLRTNALYIHSKFMHSHSIETPFIERS